MIYHQFRLDASSEENRGKINPLKAKALEKALKDEKFTVLASSTGTNGARNSLLVGVPSANQALPRIEFAIRDLDLPYFYQESYS